MYLQEGRYEEAERVLNKALELDERTGNIQQKAKDLNLLGIVYFLGRRFDEARDIIKSLLRIYRMLDNTDEINRLGYFLYLIRMQRKRPDKDESHERIVEEIRNMFLIHDLGVHRRFDKMESEVNEIREHIQSEHMDLVKEFENLNKLQLKDLDIIIQEMLDQIQDVNAKKALESRWQRVIRTISISADFLTLVSSAITIHNAVSGGYDIASSIAAMQTLMSRIKEGTKNLP